MPVGRGFQKGQSGNPGGRPKAHTAIAKLVRERTDDGAKLVDFAIKVWNGEVEGMKTERSRAWAHDWLTDRGFGKPQEFLELSGGNGAPPLDDRELTDAELAVLAKLDSPPNRRPTPGHRIAPGDRPDGDGPGDEPSAG